jgi:hypothetical protein
LCQRSAGLELHGIGHQVTESPETRAGHAYKSSAGTIRAIELNRLLAQLEASAKAGAGMTKVMELRDRIITAHDAVMAKLRAWLEANPSR